MSKLRRTVLEQDDRLDTPIQKERSEESLQIETKLKNIKIISKGYGGEESSTTLPIKHN